MIAGASFLLDLDDFLSFEEDFLLVGDMLSVGKSRISSDGKPPGNGDADGRGGATTIGSAGGHASFLSFLDDEEVLAVLVLFFEDFLSSITTMGSGSGMWRAGGGGGGAKALLSYLEAFLAAIPSFSPCNALMRS